MDEQGHGATRPWQMPRKALLAIARRALAETGADNIGLIAAGVAFYGFLALVPLLGAIVLVYGLVASPHIVMQQMASLTAIVPDDIARLVGEQLMNVVETSDGKKGLGLLLALVLALFGARSGAGAIITALNVAYDEEERRGFLRVNLLGVAITAGAVLTMMLALVAVAALGYLQSLIPGAPAAVILAGKIGAYLGLVLAGAAAAATLYRFGPCRRSVRWVWLTPGSILAALLWLALTVGFGIYVANFGNYNATYGSLGAVVVTLTWLYLSSYVLLFGAELNAEFEHQTAGVGPDDAEDAGPQAQAVCAGPVAPPPPTPGRTRPRLPTVSRPATLMASLGLSLLRRGEALPGLALLGTVAAVAWLRRDRPAGSDS